MDLQVSFSSLSLLASLLFVGSEVVLRFDLTCFLGEDRFDGVISIFAIAQSLCSAELKIWLAK